MRKIIAWLSVLALTILLPACAIAEEETDYENLSSLTAAYGFRLGAPLSYGQMWDRNYQAFVAKHFNSITTTNEMKAYSLLDQTASRKAEDGMPRMNYKQADEMVAWAQKNGIGVRGHVLVWDAYMCDWFFRVGYANGAAYADAETIKARTEYYITQVVNHFEEKFPGVVYCWDVVNEAVGDNAGEFNPSDPRHLRIKRNGGVNLFQKYMGDDYVELAFLYARNAVDALGADIKLYYNDYNAYFAEKATAIRALAKSVNSFAVDENSNPRKLMDGIGMQGYIGGYGVQEGCLVDSHVDMIKNEIQNYAALDLEVQITEMAVRNFDKEQAEKHAAFYAKLFSMFTSLYQDGETPLKAVSIWGLTDYPKEPKGTYVYNLNSPYGGLVTEKYQYKDAFRQVYGVLKGE
jgi:endo-1,4-beta-xylanase